MAINIYSRAVVAWEIHREERAELAAELMRKACLKHGIQPNQIHLHSDNGGPMKGATMLATLQKLGVVPSFSRPSVSNDNPFSESLFKTMKFTPNYPKQPFGDLNAARAWVLDFVTYYNEDHRHSGINYVTPMHRHLGQDVAILAPRKELIEKQQSLKPSRWKGRQTRNCEL